MGDFLSDVVFRATHKTIAPGFDRTGCFDVFFFIPHQHHFGLIFRFQLVFFLHGGGLGLGPGSGPKITFYMSGIHSLGPDYIYKKFRATELGW